MRGKPAIGVPFTVEREYSPKRALAGWRRSAVSASLRLDSLQAGNYAGKLRVLMKPVSAYPNKVYVLSRSLKITEVTQQQIFWCEQG